MKGIACDIYSAGYHAFANATRDVIGECKPYSDLGGLPLVADLQVLMLMMMNWLIHRLLDSTFRLLVLVLEKCITVLMSIST